MSVILPRLCRLQAVRHFCQQRALIRYSLPERHELCVSSLIFASEFSEFYATAIYPFWAADSLQFIVPPFARPIHLSVRLSVRDKSEHLENGDYYYYYYLLEIAGNRRTCMTLQTVNK